jgi:hypothetical protein
MSSFQIFVARPEPLLAPLLFLASDLLVALTVGRRAASAARASARASAAAAALRKDAKSLSSPATFAAAAKLERQALALEREVERLSSVEAGSSKSLPVKIANAVKAIVFVALLVRWWGQPVAVLRPPESVWPLARWLAQPHSSRKNAAFGGASASNSNGGNSAVLFGGVSSASSSSSASFAGIAILPWLAASRLASAAVARALLGKAALA